MLLSWKIYKEVVHYDRNDKNGIRQQHRVNDCLGDLHISIVHESWYHFGITIFLCLNL